MPYLLMLLSSLAFAVMATCIHALRGRCDWQVIVLARAGLQLLFALALAGVGGVRLSLWRPGWLWVRSIAGSVAMVCMFFAYTRMEMANVLTLTNTFPLWVALLSWPLLRQTPSMLVWLAVASGVLGVLLIQPPQLAEGLLAPQLAEKTWAFALSLVSALFTAIAYIALSRLGDVDARAIIVHFSTVALSFCVAALFLFERSFTLVDLWQAETLLLLLGVGAFAMTGQFLLTRAFAAGEAASVAVVGLTQVIFALIFDVLLFGHSFAPVTLLGMVLVLTPTAWLMVSRGK
jgi:drug/metabolite transporter (DMT)-like permease